MSEIVLRPAATEADVPLVRRLFRDYAAWFEETFHHDLCFQGFEEELAGLPGKYAPPAGNIWVAESAEGPLGIVAIRPLEGDICEMKRLWVAGAARGTGLGRRLIEASFAGARDAGYRRMRLDTIGGMAKAIALYREYGFHEIPPYCENPLPEVVYLELEL
jgi:ribosomal protein S18 acetylase RimI-like enzyme